jgi:hypothetical protein
MIRQLPAPYPDEHTNAVYNLMFCDEPALFRGGAELPAGSDLAIVGDENSAAADVRRIAQDSAAESRMRMLAFHWLRRHGLGVEPKIHLGTIVEVQMEGFLDTLAVYVDERARLIGRNGRMTFVETPTEAMKQPIKGLLAASKRLVDQLGPSDTDRLAEPGNGMVRLSFLVSDGLYFGHGPLDQFFRDKMAGPALAFATQLLQAIVDLDPKPGQPQADGAKPAAPQEGRPGLLGRR